MGELQPHSSKRTKSKDWKSGEGLHVAYGKIRFPGASRSGYGM